MDVCTWYVQEQVVDTNGVGCAKLRGQENVWATTGLVKYSRYFVEKFINIFIYLLKEKFVNNALII